MAAELAGGVAGVHPRRPRLRRVDRQHEGHQVEQPPRLPRHLLQGLLGLVVGRPGGQRHAHDGRLCLHPHCAEAALRWPLNGDAGGAGSLVGGQAGGQDEVGGAADPGRLPRPHDHSPRHTAGQGIRWRGHLCPRCGGVRSSSACGDEPHQGLVPPSRDELLRPPQRFHREELLPEQFGRRRLPRLRAPADVHQDHGPSRPDVPRRRAVEIRLHVAEHKRGEVRAARPAGVQHVQHPRRLPALPQLRRPGRAGRPGRRRPPHRRPHGPRPRQDHCAVPGAVRARGLRHRHLRQGLRLQRRHLLLQPLQLATSY